jgi:tripartite-type tricarboxylate transporter receptor subunit TctC
LRRDAARNHRAAECSAGETASTPSYRDRLTEQGYDVLSSTPEQMASSTRGEIAKWGKIVKASGAKVD